MTPVKKICLNMRNKAAVRGQWKGWERYGSTLLHKDKEIGEVGQVPSGRTGHEFALILLLMRRRLGKTCQTSQR